MKEIQEILKKLAQMPLDEKAVLATVVDVQGSAYRRAGAKMLICESGETFGTVSGGCLEADMLERAKNVSQTGIAQVFVYDTSKNEDSVFSLNMGCRGVIRILLETVSEDYFKRLNRSFEKRQTFVNATVIERPEDTTLTVGKRFFLDLEENSMPFLHSKLAEISIARHSVLESFEIDGKPFEIFFEIIKPPLELYIFGAGADAMPLYEMARTLGWKVFMIDHRTAYANADRFSDADGIFVLHPENYAGNFRPDAHSVAVVMTHNYEKDRQIQQFLLKTNTAYIGALGPKKRTEKLLAEIGADWPPNLYAPVGLDIGAETPQEIALAVMAEIQSVLKNRHAGFLRDKESGIHAD